MCQFLSGTPYRPLMNKLFHLMSCCICDIWDNEEMYMQIYVTILKQLKCFSLDYVKHYRKMYKWDGISS